MNDYERQRVDNIRRNQSLLKELKLDKRPSTTNPRPASTIFTSNKRRKLSHPPPPTRASARISAASRPNYNEDGIHEKAAGVTEATTRRTVAGSKARVSVVDKTEEIRLEPSDAENANLIESWTSWTPSGAEASRDEDNILHFADYPDFTPNKTPTEILQEGCFGGGYYRPIWSKTLRMTIQGDWEELPKEWIEGLDVNRFLLQKTYNPEVNKYKVACGQSIEEWEAAGTLLIFVLTVSL